MFTELFEGCMSGGIFPALCKSLKLVQQPKADKPVGDSFPYSLDSIEKILERVIYNRLLPITESQGGLSDR